MKIGWIFSLIFTTSVFAQLAQTNIVIDGEGQSVINYAGGNIKAGIVEQVLGSTKAVKKHLGQTLNEDFEFSLNLPLSKKFTEMANNTFTGNQARLNGFFSIENNGTFTADKEFRDALISGITFPALDASLKSSYMLRMNLAPEVIVMSPKGSGKFNPTTVSRERAISSNFRMELDGISRMNVSKIDPIVVTQKMRLVNNGGSSFSTIEPTRLEISNITIYLMESQAKELLIWFEDFVMRGKNSDADEKSGRIVLLDPSLTKVIMTIELSNVGIFSYSTEEFQQSSGSTRTPSTLNRRVKVELYVERISLK